MLLTSQVYQFSRWRGTGPWGANVFLLVGDTLTLVDTGFKGRLVHILKELARLGHSPADVTDIVITHHHADHTGSLASLKEVTRGRVAAHPADAPYIDGHLPQPGPARPDWLGGSLTLLHSLWETVPVAVDALLNDGDELPVAGGVRVIHTPGHTPGSISLYLKTKKLVIVGDLLSNTRGLSLPSRAFTTDPGREIESVKRLAALDFDMICFGHGLPIKHHAREAILDFTRRIERKYLKTGIRSQE